MYRVAALVYIRPVTVKIALVALLLSASCQSAPPVRVVAPGGDAVEYLPDDAVLRLVRGEDALLRLPLSGLVIGSVPQLDERLTYDPYWLENGAEVLPNNPPEDLRWHAATAATVTRAEPAGLTLDLRFDEGLSGSLDLSTTGEGRFAATFTPATGQSGRAVAFLRLQARASEDEGFYGMGEWPDEVNHRGKVRPMQMEFDATESTNNENHVPVPLLVGTRGWGLFVASRRVGVFDVAHKEPDLIEVTYGTAQDSGAGLRFHLFAAAHPLDVQRRYFEVTGYPLLPAPWGLGPWLWRNENRDQAEVEDDVKTLRALDLATSGLWIDRPYATAVNTFDFNPARYTDPARMVRAAHAAGLRVALWSTPYLEPAATALRDEATQKGYFPPRAGIALNGWGDPIDLSNPAAYTFWQSLIRRYTAGGYAPGDPHPADLGIEGFKLDYAEDVVPGLGMTRNTWRFADGSDERTMHFDYTLLYHRVYAETLPQSGGYLLCRAGRWGDQKNVSVIWPGDMDASFTRHRERFVPRGSNKEVVGVGGLPATVVQALTLSASGFPFFGADTGGYRHGPPDRELYIRWFQQTALSAVMNVGDSSSEPPWKMTEKNGRDARSLEIYRAFARLHLRLFPYAWTYAQRMKEDGRPLLRAVGLAYPDLGAHPSDQYMFGEELLVAPVVDRGLVRRTVVLPRGEWLGFWDGQRYAGGATVEVPAPLDPGAQQDLRAGLPLLARAGAIVPLLRPTIDTLAPATDAGVDSFGNDAGLLYARLFPGPAPSRFRVYDGATVTQAPDGVVTVADGAVFRAGTVLERLATPRPAAVTLDGAPLAEQPAAMLERAPSGWAWEAAGGGTLWLKLPAGAHEARWR